MFYKTTGLGLKFAIEVDNFPGYDWMAFGCWYSFYRNLPDAEISLIFKRIIDPYLFKWAKKVNIKIVKEDSGFVINPFLLVLDELKPYEYDNIIQNKKIDFVDVKSRQISTFVYWRNGISGFVVNDWINNEGNPLLEIERFIRQDASINEIKVIEMFAEMSSMYQTLKG